MDFMGWSHMESPEDLLAALGADGPTKSSPRDSTVAKFWLGPALLSCPSPLFQGEAGGVLSEGFSPLKC